MTGIIRLARKEDLDRITDLLNKDPHLSLDGSKGQYNKEDVLEFINAKINKSLVYEINRIVVGVIIAQFWKTYSYLHLIVIDKKFQNKGIGTLLMNEIEKQAKDKGINFIESITEKDNLKMQGLFNKLKYKRGNKFISYLKNI